MQVKHELLPIYNQDSEVLILGSIPSQKSRLANFYYAHPQNRFWPVMSLLYHVSLATNQDKINFCYTNHLALWDTIASCDINGSSDSSIKNIQVNDINKLIKTSKINRIYCTGKAAYNIYNKYIYNKTLIKANYLPSPSPANAKFSLNELVKIYKIIKIN
jgi:double-stranded uracil-DNA glycosylase